MSTQPEEVRLGPKERKLTEKELKRKEAFEALCLEMQQSGYRITPLILGMDVWKANLAAPASMLPFIALAA